MTFNMEMLNKFIVVYNDTIEKVFNKYSKDLFRIETEDYWVKISNNPLYVRRGDTTILKYIMNKMRRAGLYAGMETEEVHYSLVDVVYISLSISLLDHTSAYIINKGAQHE